MQPVGFYDYKSRCNFLNNLGSFFKFKDLSFIETFHPDYTVQGKPRYYAQFDVGNFILAPTPNAATTLKFSICSDLLV